MKTSSSGAAAASMLKQIMDEQHHSDTAGSLDLERLSISLTVRASSFLSIPKYIGPNQHAWAKMRDVPMAIAANRPPNL